MNYVTNLLKKLAGFSNTYIQNSKILEANEADYSKLKSLNTPIGESLMTSEFMSSFDPLFQEQVGLIKIINDLCRQTGHDLVQNSKKIRLKSEIEVQRRLAIDY